MKPKFVRIWPARLASIGGWSTAFTVCALALGGTWGCSSERNRMETPQDEEWIEQTGDVDTGVLGSLGAQLALSVSDPDAWYAGGDTHPWYRFSTVTHAESFTLRVTNEGRRASGDVQLLVAVPGDLPEVGWSVTIGDPGVVYTSLSEFDHRLLTDTHYPKLLPHHVYWRQGNARFLVVTGPRSLDPGATWEIPIQVFRGATDNFMVHFDAAGVRTFVSPLSDVTAQPPYNGDGGEFTESVPVAQ